MWQWTELQGSPVGWVCVCRECWTPLGSKSPITWGLWAPKCSRDWTRTRWELACPCRGLSRGADVADHKVSRQVCRQCHLQPDNQGVCIRSPPTVQTRKPDGMWRNSLGLWGTTLSDVEKYRWTNKRENPRRCVRKRQCRKEWMSTLWI